MFGDNAVPAMPDAPKDDAQRRGSDSSITETTYQDARRRVRRPSYQYPMCYVLTDCSPLLLSVSATSKRSSDPMTQRVPRGVRL